MDAQTIIDEVSAQLNDEGLTTWTEEKLLRYITTGIQAITFVRPDAYSLVDSVQLAAGSKQDLPAGYRRLVEVKRNLGTDGNTPGRPINNVEEDAHDLFELAPESPAAVVKDYSYDERTPRTFYVYPPNDGTGWVEFSAMRTPPDVTAPEQELVLGDIYRNALVQWVMFRAYSIEVDSASSQQRAQEHEQSFYQMMGVKSQRDVQFSGSVEVEP